MLFRRQSDRGALAGDNREDVGGGGGVVADRIPQVAQVHAHARTHTYINKSLKRNGTRYVHV